MQVLDASLLLSRAQASASEAFTVPDFYRRFSLWTLGKPEVFWELAKVRNALETVVGTAAELAGADSDRIESCRINMDCVLTSFDFQAALLHLNESLGTQSGNCRADTDAYQILGVSPGVTINELRRAYHLKMKEWHPDRLEGMAPELLSFATERVARINEAHADLKQRLDNEL